MRNVTDRTDGQMAWTDQRIMASGTFRTTLDRRDHERNRYAMVRTGTIFRQSSSTNFGGSAVVIDPRSSLPCLGNPGAPMSWQAG